jgi:hypothetical protein
VLARLLGGGWKKIELHAKIKTTANEGEQGRQHRDNDEWSLVASLVSGLDFGRQLACVFVLTRPPASPEQAGRQAGLIQDWHRILLGLKG